MPGYVKSSIHHWWPEVVSQTWADPKGFVNRLQPDGSTQRAPPRKFGSIKNAHTIKLSPDPSVRTVWDEEFEKEFDHADNAFRSFIDWLKSLKYPDHVSTVHWYERFLSYQLERARLETFTECLVSLAVRSPKSRREAASWGKKTSRGAFESGSRDPQRYKYARGST